jgi:hypothetical protein
MFYFMVTEDIHAVCVDLRTNENCLVAFYTGEAMCLLRGTDCTFNVNQVNSGTRRLYGIRSSLVGIASKLPAGRSEV